MVRAGAATMFAKTVAFVRAVCGIADWRGTAIRRRRPVNFVVVGVFVAVVPFEVGLVRACGARCICCCICRGIGEKEESGDGGSE
jgi:hypothetical protein